MINNKTKISIMSDFVNNDMMERILLITKPEQSGKTFMMINMINDFIKKDENTEHSTINFIFCDNSLLLTQQTTKRVKKDVNNLPGTKENYIEFSSSKKAGAGNADSVIVKVHWENYRNITCCTNGKRLADLSYILDRIGNIPGTEQKYHFNIWLDEADKFVKHISKTFEPILKKHYNVTLYCLTATPQPLFNKYSELSVIPIENTTIPDYHGWNDNNIIIRKCSGCTSTFAYEIADEIEGESGFTPGKKGYVPADTNKRSHRHIRDIFLAKNVAVYVVNGDGIELSMPDGTRILVPKTKTLEQHLKELYVEYDIKKWSCIVTGNICVGRGLSIMQKDFFLDFAILSNTRKKTEVSQNAGRLKGNFKGWSNYKIPTIYTTKKFDKIAKDYEEMSRNIAKLAWEKNSKSPTKISKADIKNKINDKDWELYTQEFDTLDDANNFLKKHGARQKKSFKYDESGSFKLSSTTKQLSILDYEETIAEIKGWGKKSLFDIRKNNDKPNGTMIVCYKDTANAESAVYIVRVLKKKPKKKKLKLKI